MVSQATQREYPIAYIGIPKEFMGIPRGESREFIGNPKGIHMGYTGNPKGIPYGVHRNTQGIHMEYPRSPYRIRRNTIWFHRTSKGKSRDIQRAYPGSS